MYRRSWRRGGGVSGTPSALRYDAAGEIRDADDGSSGGEITLRLGGLVSLYGDCEVLAPRPRKRQIMAMARTIRATGMVTPIMTLEAVESPGLP